MSHSDGLKTVSVVGLGYIGLPTASVLAARGVDVVGVDINATVVERLNRGLAHFAEPGLDAVVTEAVASGRLRAVTAPVKADAFIIAVPTPFTTDRTADLSYVESATRAVARVLEPGNLVILESTCPVGTTRVVCAWIAEERPDLVVPTDEHPGDIDVAYCPERILPGRMVDELTSNDRIIGGINERSSARACDLYGVFVSGALHTTTSKVAEMVKLAENAYRDVNIAFANELAQVCASFGVDVWSAISLANHHPRVNILQPGPGVGGHCIGVDPWFLINHTDESAELMRTARAVNDAQPPRVVAHVRAATAGLEAPVVACLGLTYKPDVDDLRESPAVSIVGALAADGMTIRVVDPHVHELPAALDTGTTTLVADAAERAIAEADVVVVLVAHTAFRALAGRLAEARSVIDTVGLLQRR